MSFAYQSFLFIHVGVGFASLVLFWVPIFTRKGSARHINTGHWYAKAMYVVSLSALVLSLMLMLDPLAFKFSGQQFTAAQELAVVTKQKDIGLFLLAISILVAVNVRHGVQTLKNKSDHALMRSADNFAINALLLAVGVWLAAAASGGSPLSVLFYVFAGLCSVTAVRNLMYCFKTTVSRGEQIIAHLGGMIGAGIGSHTAFAVFGANRLLSELLTGYAAIIPWVLPGVVGGWIIAVQSRRYRPSKRAVTGQPRRAT